MVFGDDEPQASSGAAGTDPSSQGCKPSRVVTGFSVEIAFSPLQRCRLASLSRPSPEN